MELSYELIMVEIIIKNFYSILNSAYTCTIIASVDSKYENKIRI